MPNEEEQKNDKYAKLRPVVDMLRANFRSHWVPAQDVTIDESMVASKARCSMVQFVPSKPTRFGFKVWCIADSITGYIIEFEMYEGKKDDDREVEDLVEDKDENVDDLHGHVPNDIESLVVRLCDALPQDRKFNVFADSLFATVQLAKILVQKGRLLCGTVKLNSVQLPPSLSVSAKFLGKGQSLSIVDSKDNVAVYVKKEKKTFALVTSLHSPEKMSFDVVRNEYNQKARGVDLANQRMTYYAPQRRTIKWWHTVFDFLINASVANAYVLASSRANYSKSELRFRMTLITDIFSRYCTTKLAVSLASSRHVPVRGEKKNICHGCSKKGKKRAKTRYYCKGCSSGCYNVHLHPRCFEEYHQ